MPKLNMDALTKGEIRKLNALKKSVGDELGEEVFIKWLVRQPKADPKPKADPIAEKIAAALEPYAKEKSFRLGNFGYTVKRARRRSESGPAFVITRNPKPGS